MNNSRDLVRLESKRSQFFLTHPLARTEIGLNKLGGRDRRNLDRLNEAIALIKSRGVSGSASTTARTHPQTSTSTQTSRSMVEEPSNAPPRQMAIQRPRMLRSLVPQSTPVRSNKVQPTQSAYRHLGVREREQPVPTPEHQLKNMGPRRRREDAVSDSDEEEVNEEARPSVEGGSAKSTFIRGKSKMATGIFTGRIDAGGGGEGKFQMDIDVERRRREELARTPLKKPSSKKREEEADKTSLATAKANEQHDATIHIQSAMRRKLAANQLQRLRNQKQTTEEVKAETEEDMTDFEPEAPTQKYVAPKRSSVKPPHQNPLSAGGRGRDFTGGTAGGRSASIQPRDYKPKYEQPRWIQEGYSQNIFGKHNLNKIKPNREDLKKYARSKNIEILPASYDKIIPASVRDPVARALAGTLHERRGDVKGKKD